MSKIEERMEDLISVGESIAEALQRKDPPPRVTVEPATVNLPTIDLNPTFEVPPAPPNPPPEVVVNLPEGPPKEKTAYEVEVTERSGQGYIRKMTITPL